jgi:hypothetical protein
MKTYEVVPDEDPPSPRGWDNLGVMMCAHRRYNLGDLQAPSTCGSWDGVRRYIESKHGPLAVCLPIFMMDHSGLSVSTSDTWFRAADSQGWDWGRIGFIFVTKKKVYEEYGVKRISPKLRNKVTEYLNNEVKAYDRYLRGDYWGYRILDENGEVVDSCWGFDDRERCEKEAKELCTM